MEDRNLCKPMSIFRVKRDLESPLNFWNEMNLRDFVRIYFHSFCYDFIMNIKLTEDSAASLR